MIVGNALHNFGKHLYNLKNVKNTHEGLLLSKKLQALFCNFANRITPPWVFLTFFKLYKW